LIAVVEDGVLKGFNLVAGGGLSSTHGNPANYARLASMLGFVDTEEKTLKAIYEVMTIQRDYGNRSDRKLARLKYTIDKMGVDAFKSELKSRCGFSLKEPRPYTFTERKDYYGWHQNNEGLWYYTLFVENGRVVDEGGLELKTALYEIARTGKTTFRFTPNQNVIISDIKSEDKLLINAILEKYGLLSHTDGASPLRKNAIACVAFNTCPLALAEAQRYLPSLIDKIEPLLEKHGLGSEAISLRMTGCPNGCGRSPLAEIGFIGTAYGKYNLQLGGDREGLRLNKTYKKDLEEPQILEELDLLFALFSNERLTYEETFGDFVMRKELV
jgi:sulfite reductase (NADPH) hemoprotein beta-component